MASNTKVRTESKRSSSQKELLLFLTVWIAGLILGACTAAVASNSYFLLMRIAPGSNVTIVGLAVSTSLPFLLSAYAVYTDRTLILYPACFLKAFTFALTGCSIYAAYGSAGWLVQALFQFSDICTLPILCWFVIRHSTSKQCGFQQDLVICLVAEFVVFCLDLWYVSPFLASIT